MKLTSSITPDNQWHFCIAGDFSALDAILVTNKIEAIELTSCPKVVVDISAVTFIESSALGSLIYCHKFLEKRGKTLFLADTHEHAMMLFRNCPLEKVLNLVEPTNE